jgi:hypothetical protein
VSPRRASLPPPADQINATTGCNRHDCGRSAISDQWARSTLTRRWRISDRAAGVPRVAAVREARRDQRNRVTTVVGRRSPALRARVQPSGGFQRPRRRGIVKGCAMPGSVDPFLPLACSRTGQSRPVAILPDSSVDPFCFHRHECPECGILRNSDRTASLMTGYSTNRSLGSRRGHPHSHQVIRSAARH